MYDLAGMVKEFQGWEIHSLLKAKDGFGHRSFYGKEARFIYYFYFYLLQVGFWFGHRITEC